MVLTGRDIRVAVVALALAALITGAVGASVIFSGRFDVAATTPHWRITHWVLETARTQSIRHHATGLTAPAGLDNEENLVMGTEHFAAHCAVCHGAPGVPRGDIAHGLYPPPPDLSVQTRYTKPELFWVLRHGIKSTGMPAWKDHDDRALWSIVAFLRRLPEMGEADYAKLIMTGLAGGGQHHHGDAEVPAGDSGAAPH